MAISRATSQPVKKESSVLAGRSRGSARTERSFRSILPLVPSRSGGQRFFSGIINDLSARARLQAEIDRQSLLFQAVFDHVPEALVISSPDGQIILVNPVATAYVRP